MYEWLTFMPFLFFAIIWLVVYLFTGKHRTAAYAGMDVTAFLLLGSIFNMLYKLSGSPWTGWGLVFVFLLAGGFIGRRQERRKSGFNMLLMLRTVSRTGFVLMTPLYLLLLLLTLL
ncbi:MAG: hypothetical protein K0R57_5319 [Paenibacillaceae bacterium]|jgi:hypothetical protein|nr:hypothetical protein [Paenibacillaceae bacterium]